MIAAQQAMCGSVRYGDAETTVLACYLSRRSELHRITFTKLARRNGQ
jgi:hypothetical protein